jgi:hypothetical protein
MRKGIVASDSPAGADVDAMTPLFAFGLNVEPPSREALLAANSTSLTRTSMPLSSHHARKASKSDRTLDDASFSPEIIERSVMRVDECERRFALATGVRVLFTSGQLKM